MDAYTAAAAAELRAAQARKKLTDIALAKKSGIPVSTLRRYLRGERDTPASALFHIAQALNTQPGRILDDALNRLNEQ